MREKARRCSRCVLQARWLPGRPCRLIERITGKRPLPPHLRGAVIALGNFDGFHLGHQAVIGRAVQMARERGVAAIVGTFDPRPVRYFGRGLPPFRLTSLDQRQQLFAMAGVDAMTVFEFDDALAVGRSPGRACDAPGPVSLGDEVVPSTRIRRDAVADLAVRD